MKTEMHSRLLRHGTPTLFAKDVQHRVLSACVGVSIMLHVAVLFVFPGFRPDVRAASSVQLTATFSSTLVKPETQAVPKSLWRPRSDVNPETQRPVLATSKPVPDVAQRAELPTPVPDIASAAPPESDTTRAPEALATPGQSIEKYLAEAADAGLLEKYRLALIDAAKRYRRYPIHAIEKGWQGRVEIRLVVGSDGTIKNTLIKKSSNYQILDDQALDMVRKGTGREPIPSVLRGREFTLDIPVIFELQAG